MSGSGVDDKSESGEATWKAGKVIGYGEFLRALAARDGFPGEPGSEAPPVADQMAETVQEIRARIRTGFYDQPEVVEETVRRILLSLGRGERLGTDRS